MQCTRTSVLLLVEKKRPRKGLAVTATSPQGNRGQGSVASSHPAPTRSPADLSGDLILGLSDPIHLVPGALDTGVCGHQARPSWGGLHSSKGWGGRGGSHSLLALRAIVRALHSPGILPGSSVSLWVKIGP